MSGHSKWSTIKHKKAAADAKRGKAFTKLIKELTVAARLGGGDPEANPRLRSAIASAKAENMPKDNIDRAIKKGTGELEGVSYEETNYEGYAPGGVAVLVDVLTDNRNRAASEIRHIFTKNGGSIGEAGCVAWMFDKKGYIVVKKDKADEDSLMEAALEAGAEDVKEQDSEFEVIAAPEDFTAVRDTLDEQGFEYEMAKVTMFPQTTVQIEDPATAQKVLKLMDALDDCDDVQDVYANFDIPDEIIASLE
jgi:YebC/PmpR family DNA-binding regulatory protein